VQAYQIAQLAGFRSKMPKLAEVLKAWAPREPKTRQAPAQIKDVMGQWAAVMAASRQAAERRNRKPPA
jgi:hypothetical protein